MEFTNRRRVGSLSVLPILCFLLSLLPKPVFTQSLVINEFLASNRRGTLDEDGDSSDWIELYNAGDEPVELAGLALTDDEQQPGRWRFPPRTLAPGGYLLVWASGKDRSGDELHSNFKLSASGEFVGLYAGSGQQIDGVGFDVQKEDISMARIPDGSGGFEPTAEPTPAARNVHKVPPGDALVFSPTSGFFEHAVDVTLASPLEGVTIRFTTNGSKVRTSSRQYDAPLTLSETTVIRARAYSGTTPVSEDISQIYLIDYQGTLPVLSYATDESNLFGKRGIFENPNKSGREWERPVSVNFVELDGSGFQINAGVRTHGGRSRRQGFPKLSTRLYFRRDYGESRLRYRLFDSKKIDRFDRLVIHSGGSSDQFHRKEGVINKQWSLIRDPLNHTLWHEHNGAVSASRPVVLFVNGDPWGIYHLRERVEEFYLESNYGITDADLLRPNDEKVRVQAGDRRAWNRMFSFFENHDLDSGSNYERARELIDLDNLIDFFVFNIYAGNWDMPHTNIYFFRERAAKAKWHWVMWDTDVSYGSQGSGLPPSTRTLRWATRDVVVQGIAGTTDEPDLLWSTLILRRLLDNDDFKTRFVNRFADLMNTTLHPDHIAGVVEQMADRLRPNIRFETDKWPGAKASDWENGIKTIREWAADRPQHQRDHLRSVLRVGADREVNLDLASGQGRIRINSIMPEAFPWQGTYFTNVAIELEALPAAGFEFSHWSGATPSDDRVVELELDDNKSITAHFDRADVPLSPIIHSFNPESGSSGSTVTIVGEHFVNVTFVAFNARAAEFSVQSETEIQATVPDSASTGPVAVKTVTDSVVSETYYVVLQDSSAEDSVATGILDPRSSGRDRVPAAFSVTLAYPNPFNARTTIEYGLPQEGHVKLVIYNLLGQAVRTLVDEFQLAGFQAVRWDGQDQRARTIGSGVYFVRLIAGGRTVTQKILLQK
ncbi:MAG: CotH kinase family protein [bacterium]